MMGDKGTIAPDGTIIPEAPWARLIVGNCPNCGAVVAVINYGEVWPLMKCPCGWTGDTHAPLNKMRFGRLAVPEPCDAIAEPWGEEVPA